ncbi:MULTISPECIES: TauD/TfdA family dioxygenase [unclassified Streptomyces]|uniref:TauD/TfdA family dioxygenase n=1 Tax=unclassified Streptomyces TaxID=2593676 RepID=UPI002E0D30C4|nr:TauD/TfdA family dioxygenase [Streptomyces sp. NBC_01296]WSW60996.1 TauD/TfdA family dioxygenase [Streptomyces sp. NBC_00998]
MNSNDPFSTVRHPVDRALATAVAESGEDDVRTGRYREFGESIRQYVRRHLDARPGYFVLGGLDHLTEEQARRFTVAVSRLAGDLLPQDGAGALLRDVRDRGVRLGEGATGRYSDSRQGGSLHTDAAHRPGRLPDIFTLFCFRQASSGGALVTVHVSDLLEILRAHPEELAALRLPVHFDTRDDTPGVPLTTERPVLEFRGGRERMYYLRDYIEIGHRHPHVPPLTPEQVKALDLLDSLLDRRDLQTHGRLAPGEMIFIDNRSIVHGRTAFDDEKPVDGGRLMLRTWIGLPEHGEGTAGAVL